MFVYVCEGSGCWWEGEDEESRGFGIDGLMEKNESEGGRKRSEIRS